MATATQPFTGVYELDRNHSTVQFAVRHVQVSKFRASFADIDARLVAEDDAIALAGRALVESISIVEPPEFREHVVHGVDFFDADAHRAIRFRSTSVEMGDDESVTVSGQLTIRGVSRSVTAHGTYRPPREDPFGAYRAGLEPRGDGRPPRLGDDLAAAPAGRQRRARLGRRDHGAARTGQEGLMRLLAISGSLRRGSYNSALLDAAAAQCPSDVEFVVWRGLADIPAFNEDLGTVPPAVSALDARSHDRTPSCSPRPSTTLRSPAFSRTHSTGYRDPSQPTCCATSPSRSSARAKGSSVRSGRRRTCGRSWE